MPRTSLDEMEITHFEPEDLTWEQLLDLSNRCTEIHCKVVSLMSRKEWIE